MLIYSKLSPTEQLQILQRAKKLFKDIPEDQWIAYQRTDEKGKCCVLGHASRLNSNKPKSYSTIICQESNPFFVKFFNIGRDLLPPIGEGEHFNRGGFAFANNGQMPMFQQKTVKGRSMAAIDYCIDAVEKRIQEDRKQHAMSQCKESTLKRA